MQLDEIEAGRDSDYSVFQNRHLLNGLLTVDERRGTGSFVYHDRHEREGGLFGSSSTAKSPGPFKTEAFDIDPIDSILNYSSNGSFSFTPPENFQGVARFKIRWSETDLKNEATNQKIYIRGEVPPSYSRDRLNVSLRRASPDISSKPEIPTNWFSL
jgi:hypothetical protein